MADRDYGLNLSGFVASSTERKPTMQGTVRKLGRPPVSRPNHPVRSPPDESTRISIPGTAAGAHPEPGKCDRSK